MPSIKRHLSLQPVSREHHSALLFSWQIKQGILKNISPQRMSDYASWFWQNHIAGHFEFEEKFMLTIQDVERELVHRTMQEHAILKELFKSTHEAGMKDLATLLEKHVRFEERVLFNEIERVATGEHLQIILENSNKKSECPVWHDTFWKD